VISNAELDRRWALVRKAMHENGLDWLIATTGHPYGYQRWLTNRTGLAGTLVAFPAKGEAILASHGDDVHSVPRDSYGVRHVASCAQPNIIANTHAPLLIEPISASNPRRIGFLGLGYLPAATYLALTKALPQVEFVDATDIIAPIKAVKSEEELECMRRAARMHEEAIALLPGLVRPGVTGRYVMDELRHHLVRSGSNHQTMMVGSAPAGQICRYFGPSDRVLEKGDQLAILIEGSEPDGYYSEAMPTVCLGEVPDALRKAFNDVVEIQERLAEVACPGALPDDLLRLNDELMRRKGYPPEGRLLGHSQGVDLVERPAFTPKGETMPLQKNMVISIHPTTHAPNAWGYPVNMSFLITDGAPQRMLRTPQEIIVV